MHNRDLSCFPIAVGLLTSLLLTGCASTESQDAPVHPMPQSESSTLGHPTRPTAIAPEDIDVTDLRMFNGLSGSSMTWDQLVDAATQADVVVIGESHGHPLGLAAAARLFDELIASKPGAALSMEFFERDDQIAIDDYLSGITDEEQFKKAAGRSEGNYPPGHRHMVESARQAQLRVIAANAPRRYVSLARIDGLDRLESLTPEQQRLVTRPEHLTTGRYREDFFGLMSRHGADGSGSGAASHGSAVGAGMGVEDFYVSQNVWDATMADSIARAVDDGARPVVHVVGRFHSDFSGGTVSRLAQLRPDLLVWTISMVDERHAELQPDDQGRADCVIYLAPPEDDSQR